MSLMGFDQLAEQRLANIEQRLSDLEEPKILARVGSKQPEGFTRRRGGRRRCFPLRVLRDSA
jgi:hypothetical protein